MELYIGGYAQGKLDYVMGKYPDAFRLTEAAVEKILSGKAFEQDGGTADAFPADRQKVIVWDHFHQAVKRAILGGKTQEDLLKIVLQLGKSYPNLVIISDEIGNGIVPMEREERTYREMTGRVLSRIAAQAESVERIICGIPQKLK